MFVKGTAGDYMGLILIIEAVLLSVYWYTVELELGCSEVHRFFFFGEFNFEIYRIDLK